MKTYSIGPGFFATMFFIFLVLKLCGVIAWSWFWVVSPLLVLPMVGVVCLVVWGVTQLFYYALTTKEERAKDKALAKVRKTLKGSRR